MGEYPPRSKIPAIPLLLAVAQHIGGSEATAGGPRDIAACGRQCIKQQNWQIDMMKGFANDSLGLVSLVDPDHSIPELDHHLGWIKPALSHIDRCSNIRLHLACPGRLELERVVRAQRGCAGDIIDETPILRTDVVNVRAC